MIIITIMEQNNNNYNAYSAGSLKLTIDDSVRLMLKKSLSPLIDLLRANADYKGVGTEQIPQPVLDIINWYLDQCENLGRTQWTTFMSGLYEDLLSAMFNGEVPWLFELFLLNLTIKRFNAKMDA